MDEFGIPKGGRALKGCFAVLLIAVGLLLLLAMIAANSIGDMEIVPDCLGNC